MADFNDIVNTINDVIEQLDQNLCDNNFDCYGCCHACDRYEDNNESIQHQLKDLLKELTKTRLDGLVHGRVTREQLETILRNILGDKVVIVNTNEDDLQDIEDIRLDISNPDGYGSIWYTLTRHKRMYITEVAWTTE